jgi:hypothetical protein
MDLNIFGLLVLILFLVMRRSFAHITVSDRCMVSSCQFSVLELFLFVILYTVYVLAWFLGDIICPCSISSRRNLYVLAWCLVLNLSLHTVSNRRTPYVLAGFLAYIFCPCTRVSSVKFHICPFLISSDILSITV